jgi:hypothetical protein
VNFMKDMCCVKLTIDFTISMHSSITKILVKCKFCM